MKIERGGEKEIRKERRERGEEKEMRGEKEIREERRERAR